MSITETTVRNGEWRWRFKAGLNDREIIAVSSEGYVNKADCLHGIELVKGSADAPVEEA